MHLLRRLKDRRVLAFLIPVSIVWTGWTWLMIQGDRFGLFAVEWPMSVTMAFGSFIAGATSEGGGAVAFPVMTLVFGIAPVVARDFSLMIQTVGMNAAAITILLLAIKVERNALVWASLGGALGVISGLEILERHAVPPAYAKMLFTSTWLAFAFALYWVNRYRDREVFECIEHITWRHRVLLVGTGVIGGWITAITGSGLDICTFSLLVLRLRISEKIATPTSVVLMAWNASVGFLWKGLLIDGMEPEAWNYWWVCVPIVVLGAPAGARFIKNRSRYFIAGLLYFSIALQFVWAVYVLQVYRKPLLAAFSTAVFLAGIGFFHYMASRGVRRANWLTDVKGVQPLPD